MNRRQLFFNVKQILKHPLSPFPLMVVCIGYWLPLDCITNSNSLFAISSTIVRLHVIAASTILNAMIVGCGALVIYVSAALFATLCRVSFQKTAQTALSITEYASLAIPTLGLLRPNLLVANGLWRHIILFLVTTVSALWICIRRVPLARVLFLPQVLTCVLIPLSALVLGQGAIHISRNSGGRVIRFAETSHVQHPDIVLITVDALSALHLHTYGYVRPTSPNLDGFSANAIMFDNFYANANWTRPGVASILDGARPWTHEGDVQIPSTLLTERQSLITVLESAGYDVNVVQSNAWADFGYQGIEATAYHEIFLDRCCNVLTWLSRKLPLSTTFGPVRITSVIAGWIDIALIGRPPEKTFRYLPASVELLRSASSRHPLFLWMHIMIPHMPYAAAAPFVGEFDSSPRARSAWTSEADTVFHPNRDYQRNNLLMARYDEAIVMTDDLLGKVIEMLKKQGRYDHSVIVITADHGENFLPIYGGHGGPLLREEVIRVPCLIKPPLPFAPKHESLLMEQADILPTILSYAGLPVPAGIEGRAYPGEPDNRPVFSMNRDLHPDEKTLNVAMREGDWKYVVHIGHWNHPWPQQELYDLAQDPMERANLISSEPERAATMRQRVLTEISRHGISISEYQH